MLPKHKFLDTIISDIKNISITKDKTNLSIDEANDSINFNNNNLIKELFNNEDIIYYFGYNYNNIKIISNNNKFDLNYYINYNLENSKSQIITNNTIYSNNDVLISYDIYNEDCNKKSNITDSNILIKNNMSKSTKIYLILSIVILLIIIVSFYVFYKKYKLLYVNYLNKRNLKTKAKFSSS